MGALLASVSRTTGAGEDIAPGALAGRVVLEHETFSLGIDEMSAKAREPVCFLNEIPFGVIVFSVNSIFASKAPWRAAIA